MNILLIHQYFIDKEGNFGGGVRFNEMTAEWIKEGHNVEVLAGTVHYADGHKLPQYKGKFICKEKYSENLTVIRCHVSEAYNVNYFGRLWAYFSFVFSSLFAGLFSLKAKSDIILATSPPLFVGITCYIISKIKRIPYVFEVRDLWPESAIDTGVLTNKYIIKLSYWFEEKIYKNAQKINVLTPAFREILVTKKNIPSSKIILIPNAADFSMADTALKNFNREEFRTKHGFNDKLVILYVGAHGLANGLILMINAAEKMKNKDVLFVTVGDGMQKKSLIAEAERRQLNNIKFYDPVPKTEIYKFIAASDIGTSILLRNDTFKTIYSNKTFDYMSGKKPIIMAIDGVSKKLVEDAECGLYAEPENVDEFVRCVRFFAENKNKIIEYGENGYKYAKKHFDRKMLAHKYLVEIEDLVSDIRKKNNHT